MKYLPILPAAAAAAGIVSCGTEPKQPDYVNFILINLDDAGNGDFSFSGALGYKTPNIDRLALEGMRYTNFYAAQPISGASRAGLLTGCYPNRIGFAHAPNPGCPYGISDEEETIAEVLKKRDYATAIFGKWHLGDAKKFLPLQHGFDEWYGLPYSNDMWPYHPKWKFPDLPTYEGNEILGYNLDQTTLTTDYTERSVKFIRENRERPFFLYLAHSMPHVPLAVSDKFKGKSEQGLYGDVMMELDWSVGEVLRTLEELGLERNTLVIFTSDNGPWIAYGNHAGSTGGLREAKATTFNGGLRVPLIARWKGTIPAGTVCERLASNIDLLPTFAQIAQAPLPAHKIDGVSMLPLLEDPDAAPVRDALCLYYQDNSLEAVTDGTYKLIFPHDYLAYGTPGDDGMPGEMIPRRVEEKELYDMRRDPGERCNVLSQHPEIAEKLEAVAERYRAELGDDLTGCEGTGRRKPGYRQSRQRRPAETVPERGRATRIPRNSPTCRQRPDGFYRTGAPSAPSSIPNRPGLNGNPDRTDNRIAPRPDRNTPSNKTKGAACQRPHLSFKPRPSSAPPRRPAKGSESRSCPRCSRSGRCSPAANATAVWHVLA